MNFFKIADYLRNGNFAIVAVTRKCNCRCPACNLWEKDDSMDAEEFISYLDKLYDAGFRLIEFTGGEPLMYPQLFNLVRAARDKGFFVQLMSNGTLINEKTIKKMKKYGVGLLNISVDHYDNQKASEYRSFKDINKRIEKAVEYAKKYDIFTSSTTLLTTLNCGEIEKVIDYINNDLGIPFSFCPPEVSENYPLGKNPEGTIPSKDTLLKTLNRILEKKRSGAEVVNSTSFIKDFKRWLKGKEAKYPCRAGQNIAYVDWNLNVFRCFKKGKLGNLQSLQDNFLKEMRCDECFLQCFREPSIYYYHKGKFALMRDYKMVLKSLNESGILN